MNPSAEALLSSPRTITATTLCLVGGGETQPTDWLIDLHRSRGKVYTPMVVAVVIVRTHDRPWGNILPHLCVFVADHVVDDVHSCRPFHAHGVTGAAIPSCRPGCDASRRERSRAARTTRRRSLGPRANHGLGRIDMAAHSPPFMSQVCMPTAGLGSMTGWKLFLVLLRPVLPSFLPSRIHEHYKAGRATLPPRPLGLARCSLCY